MEAKYSTNVGLAVAGVAAGVLAPEGTSVASVGLAGD